MSNGTKEAKEPNNPETPEVLPETTDKKADSKETITKEEETSANQPSKTSSEPVSEVSESTVAVAPGANGVPDKNIITKDVIKKDITIPKPAKRKKYLDKSSEGADFWVPKTRLGRMVKEGEIANMKDALSTGLPIREPEIIDILLPELDDEVLDVNMVQRMTDSGRRVRFAIMTVVGNGDGFVGVGSSKGKEVGPAIRKAIDNAKLNIIEIRRGCGSWECGCGTPHTLPFTVSGKSGSTEAMFRPAPRGVGLAVGDVAKHILRLGGIKDAWGFTRGQTRTTINFAKAVFSALRNTAKLKTTEKQIKELNIISGPTEMDSPINELEENTQENSSEEQ